MNYTYVLSVLFNTGTVTYLYFYEKQDALDIKKKLDKHISDNNKGARFQYEYHGESYSIQTDSLLVYGTQSLDIEYQLRFRRLYEEYTLQHQADTQLIKDRRAEQDREIAAIKQSSESIETEYHKHLKTVSLLASLGTLKHTLEESAYDAGLIQQFTNELDSCMSLLVEITETMPPVKTNYDSTGQKQAHT